MAAETCLVLSKHMRGATKGELAWLLNIRMAHISGESLWPQEEQNENAEDKTA